jgi:hypothetical protein
MQSGDLIRKQSVWHLRSYTRIEWFLYEFNWTFKEEFQTVSEEWLFGFSTTCSSLFYLFLDSFCADRHINRTGIMLHRMLNCLLMNNYKSQHWMPIFYVSVVVNPFDTSKLDALKHYHIIYLSISYSTQSIAIMGVTKNSTDPNMLTFASLDKVLMSSKPSISLVTVWRSTRSARLHVISVNDTREL